MRLKTLKIPTSWGRARREGYLWLRAESGTPDCKIIFRGRLSPIRRPLRRISPAERVFVRSCGTVSSLRDILKLFSDIRCDTYYIRVIFTLHSTPRPKLRKEARLKKLPSEKEAKSPITTNTSSITTSRQRSHNLALVRPSHTRYSK